MNHDNITDIATYLRAHAAKLGSRILETYPPLQSTKDPVAPRTTTLLRKALPTQALAITGTAKYLRKAKAARIVAECGAGKTYMALGTIHVLADGRPGEFGIRMALGAQRSHVLGIVYRSAAISLGCGISAGVILALSLNKVFAHWEVGSSRDPFTLALVTLLLSVVAVIACAIPARRAACIDPVVALRD